VVSCERCGESLPRTARFCPSCGSAVSRERPAEERKLVTVLFADLVGSTALADGTDAERTRALLTRFHEAMAGEIADQGGTVEKFIGDAVVAAFGAPATLEDHADRALHAALAMRERLAKLFGDTVALRIGVNTGDVVVGEPRVGSSFVTGDAVNVAARLEQAAAAGEILVGERTAAAVRGVFDFDEATTIAAKGKPAGIACRRLVRAGAIARTPGAVFVGREPELEALRRAYAAVVAEARPRRVTVVGDAGLGKTALIGEFLASLERDAIRPLIRVGRCLSSGHGSAYLPLGEIVRRHLGISESDSLELARASLGERGILGLALGLPVPPDLHPLAVRSELESAWTGFLEDLATDRPAVVVVEDLHLAEPELLELLERSLRAVRAPLFLLGTARPGREVDSDCVRLDALAPSDTDRMVDALAPGISHEIGTFVVGRAEGNPFFAKELLRTLVDRGVLELRDGEWVSHELPDDFVVPDSVRALLAARIDLLAPAEKAALQAAAVIGRGFKAEPVYELVGAGPILAELVERNFVEPREDGFAFVHALTREVAYASLTTARRARLHAQLAAWLERATETGDEVAGELAHHYFNAVRPEDVDLAWPDESEVLARLRRRAVHWLRLAARLAASRYEMREAVELLERAVALEREREARLGIWQEIAHANALYFDGTRFASAMEQAIALAPDDATLADLYGELAFQTIWRAGMWGTPPPANLIDGWIERALDHAGADSSARAKALIARCYSAYDKSADDAAEASRIADQLGDPVLRSVGCDVRAAVAFVSGDYREALEWCRRRQLLAAEFDDPETEVYAYAAAISPAVGCGELAEARRYAIRHREATRPLSPHHRLHGAALLVQLDELLGDWGGVIALQQQVEERVAENLVTPCVMNARSLLVCALARRYLGDEDEAQRLEQAGERLAMSGYGTVLDTPRLRLALHRNELAAVQSLLGEPAVRTTNWFYLSAMAAHLDGLAAVGARERVEAEASRASAPGTYLEPFALRALGTVRGDERLIDQAVRCFDSFGLAWHATQTRLLVESS
jgi:class 3 adenylate cyclase